MMPVIWRENEQGPPLYMHLTPIKIACFFSSFSLQFVEDRIFIPGPLLSTPLSFCDDDVQWLATPLFPLAKNGNLPIVEAKQAEQQRDRAAEILLLPGTEWHTKK
jgi:hypothetical protein